ncbi:MAG: hypothetical protein QOG85_13 [Gaiellaceae bacterium]|nr:hypothetical protein [Gaiellaceae bacterium]
MAALLTLETFKTRTLMPAADVDLVEEQKAGFIAARLTMWTSWIEARLRKRYAVPFTIPTPEIVLAWLVAIVTLEAYQARGWNPSDAQSGQIEQAYKDALEQVKEAADGEGGLYDLPVAQNNASSALAGAAPLGYTEQDPFTWMDRQVEAYRGR